nr:hypothetical protein [Angustibacter aerolatus]
MSRPRNQAEYLAGLVPDSVRATSVSRRGLFRGALGLSAAATLAACGGSDSSGGGGGGGGKVSGTITFGSNRLRRRAEGRRGRGDAELPEGDAGHDGEDQHRRPQHLPGADQRTCRAARTTSSPGSPASACGSSPRRTWPATSATSGRAPPASATR